MLWPAVLISALAVIGGTIVENQIKTSLSASAPIGQGVPQDYAEADKWFRVVPSRALSAIAGQYTVTGGSCNGTLIPGSEGGTIAGGPLNGTIIWSMAFYTSVPTAEGSIIVGGPLNGTRIPGGKGGTIVGGPLNGTVIPGSEGGTISGGPLNGTRMPGSEGGTIAGGPLNGIVMPPRYSPLQLICEWWATKERSR